MLPVGKKKNIGKLGWVDESTENAEIVRPYIVLDYVAVIKDEMAPVAGAILHRISTARLASMSVRLLD